MWRRYSMALLTLLLAVEATAQGFQAVGTIQIRRYRKGLPADQRERQGSIGTSLPAMCVLDADGKLLKDGLKAKELKEGVEVTLTVEQGGNGPVIKEIRLGITFRPEERQGQRRKAVESLSK